MRSEQGFTLVELLVVCAIVAILAAIGLATFLNQRVHAQDTEAKAMASTVAKAMATYEQEQGTFATASRNALIAVESAVGQARNLSVQGTRHTFEIAVDSASGADGGGPFRVEFDRGQTVRRCDAPGAGACPDSGHW